MENAESAVSCYRNNGHRRSAGPPLVRPRAPRSPCLQAQTIDLDLAAGPQALRRVLRGYSGPRPRRSALALLVTAIPFAATWTLLWYTVSAGY